MVELGDIGFFVVTVAVFVGVWALAIDAYGLLLGMGMGWFPALVVAALAGTIWPVLLLSVVASAPLMIGL